MVYLIDVIVTLEPENECIRNADAESSQREYRLF